MNLEVKINRPNSPKELWELKDGTAFRKASGEYIYRKTNQVRYPKDGKKEILIFDINSGHCYWTSYIHRVVEVSDYKIEVSFGGVE
jgi:hypothetical protein